MSSKGGKSKRKRTEETLAVDLPPGEQATASCSGEARPAEELVSGRYRKQDLMVFQCGECFNVLGDSLALCGEDNTLACLICLRVTEGVLIDRRLVVDVEGTLAGSAYYRLLCRLCGASLGFCLYSTCNQLAHLRSLFCLSKNATCCYLFETKKTVPASEVSVSFPSLKAQLEEIQAEVAQLYVAMQDLSSAAESRESSESE